MEFKNLRAALMAGLLLLSVAGCGSGTGTTPSPETTQTPVEPPLVSGEPEVANETEEPQDSHYPVEIVTYNFAGEEVTTVYEKAPERVLAVYQGSIETMIALGLEEHVIASYGLDNEVKEEWADGFSRMNYNDSSFAPDKESVITMQPDLIFSWGSLLGEKVLGDVDYWHPNGTNTYINTNTRSGGARLLEHEYADLLNIGKIFNVEDRAEAIVNQMKADVETARAAVAQQDEIPTVAVIRVGESDIRNFGMELAGDIVSSLGLNVMTSAERNMGKEDLIAADPDVIFLEYMPRPGKALEAYQEEILAAILDEPAYANMTAVLNGNVHVIMLGDIYAPAVRTGDGIRTIAEGVFPGIFD